MSKAAVALSLLCLMCGGMIGYSMAFGRIYRQLQEQGGESTPRETTKRPVSSPLTEQTASFSKIIATSTGKKVLSLDSVCEPVIEVIAEAATRTQHAMNLPHSPVKNLSRINEASRYFEESLREILDENPALSCRSPLTTEGKGQRAGYPDLLITHHPTGRHYYLDPKLYDTSSRNSSLRTFYYSPRNKTNKIQKNAHHLLLGFEHDGNDGQWAFHSWSLVDLSQLTLTLKSEYNASNQDLYRDAALIRKSP